MNNNNIKKNLKNQRYSKFDLNSISFYIILMTGQKYRIYANKNDSFQSVLNRFISEQCPSKYKNKIGVALFDGLPINFNKSIEDNKIEEGSKVVLQVNDLTEPNLERSNNNILGDSISTQASIISLDNEDRELLSNIYELLKKIERNQNLLIEQNKKYMHSCKECSHIHSSCHEHGLVLLYSNRNWICNLCRNNYSKEELTYYCSLCDFDVCNCCIGIIKKYPLKQLYHEQTKLKDFKFPCHKHKMIYCRTSRNYNKNTTWICNLCKKNYSDKIWSFYCTECDFDICLKCSKKYIPNESIIYSIGITIDDHPHKLVYMITNRDWVCNICRKSFDNDIPTYYCSKCDYDVCQNCMMNRSDEPKYPLYNEGDRESYKIKIINKDCHKHPLIYSITSRSAKKETTWICNECKKNYESNEWSFYCSFCDYDLCYDCYCDLD